MRQLANDALGTEVEKQMEEKEKAKMEEEEEGQGGGSRVGGVRRSMEKKHEGQ